MKHYERGVSLIIGVIAVVIIVIAGGIFFAGQSTQEEQAEGDAMMEKKEGDAMMEKKDGEAMMKKDGDAMEKEGDAMMKKDDAMMMEDKEDAMEKSSMESFEVKGSVLAGEKAPLIDFNETDYDNALASGKTVFLYFYADWCPTCKKEVANALYPAFNEFGKGDVVGFRVNYRDGDTDDREEELAREFGVSYQHTKVAIKNGERVLKTPETWSKEDYITKLNELSSQ